MSVRTVLGRITNRTGLACACASFVFAALRSGEHVACRLWGEKAQATVTSGRNYGTYLRRPRRHIRYEFTDSSGLLQRGSDTAPWGDRPKERQQIDILYLPSAPSWSVLVGNGHTIGLTISFLAVGLICLFWKPIVYVLDRTGILPVSY